MRLPRGFTGTEVAVVEPSMVGNRYLLDKNSVPHRIVAGNIGQVRILLIGEPAWEYKDGYFVRGPFESVSVNCIRDMLNEPRGTMGSRLGTIALSAPIDRYWMKAMTRVEAVACIKLLDGKVRERILEIVSSSMTSREEAIAALIDYFDKEIIQ